MNQAETARKIRDSLPESGLFAEKAWRISPTPFPLEKKTVKALQKLGPVLYRFQKAADLIYRRSKKGSLPEWIAGYLDQGKPKELLEIGISGAAVEEIPRVIRPDLILTEDGFAASELDSVPGGIGLTAWLAEVYQTANPESKIIGGVDGMLTGFQSIFPRGEADILISEESGDYRPEMQWLAERLSGHFAVCDAETYQPTDRDLYRFFELFDLPNIANIKDIAQAVTEAKITLTSPLKPWMEEKMWSALFWSLPLRDVWRQELRDGNYQRLKNIFPRSWVVDPVELPHQAAIPGLDIQSFAELKNFSQTERELVLKLSGFNEDAWGARSVTIGHDASGEEWAEAVDHAIAEFETAPYVLQEFHQGKRVQHPWLNEETGEIEMMDGRVRLCPYYFVSAKSNAVELGGILATICPADKKIIHGMSEAVLVPCAVESK
ncbi:MAG: hypothetical protein P1V20_13910 [Verrucomicrobiales bacterium]|nr:hypothetical protein [Verrucomicrobiales bacterium]